MVTCTKQFVSLVTKVFALKKGNSDVLMNCIRVFGDVVEMIMIASLCKV